MQLTTALVLSPSFNGIKRGDTVGYIRGSRGRVTGFCHSTPLNCICVVFHGENWQNEYNLKIFSFINIVWIVACIDLWWFQFIITFPVHILYFNGSCKPAIYLDVVFVTASFFSEEKHISYSESTRKNRGFGII